MIFLGLKFWPKVIFWGLWKHRKPILYVCLIGFVWYHGVERNISKCMGWNQLWRYLGEYWNKLNFTCLICSWSLSWSLVAIWNCYQRSRKTPTTNEASKIQFIPIFTEIPSKLISAHTFAYISLDAMIQHTHRVWVSCDERRRDFFGSRKKTDGFFWVAKNGLKDFLGMLKKVVIFLGRQILKLWSFWV